MRRLWWALLVAGCSRDIAGGAADGGKVFQAVCASCHGATGKPDAAAILRYQVRDLTAPEFRARVTPQLVADQVRKGSANGIMPMFDGVLTEAQIAAVAAYVMALPPGPAVNQ